MGDERIAAYGLASARFVLRFPTRHVMAYSAHTSEQGGAVNRDEFQKLAIERLADAKALLTMKRWAGAYYLAGYAVECGLKSCVIAYLMKTDQFPAKRFSEQCWTHDLKQLVSLAGLEADFEIARNADSDLYDNWEEVKDWSESSRYTQRTRSKAELLYAAIADKKHGVLSWIKGCW